MTRRAVITNALLLILNPDSFLSMSVNHDMHA